MSLRIAKLTIFAIMIATVGSIMVGSSVFNEQQPVKAQNMTGNMTSPSENMTGTNNASGSISGLAGGGGGGSDGGSTIGGGSDNGGSDGGSTIGGGGGGGGGSGGVIITH
jgi:hypothetical protein